MNFQPKSRIILLTIETITNKKKLEIENLLIDKNKKETMENFIIKKFNLAEKQ
jgi:DNA-binding protein YbaB